MARSPPHHRAEERQRRAAVEDAAEGDGGAVGHPRGRVLEAGELLPGALRLGLESAPRRAEVVLGGGDGHGAHSLASRASKVNWFAIDR